MKISSQNKNKKMIMLAVATIAVVVLGVGYFWVSGFFSPSKNTDQTNYEKPSKEQLEAGKDIEKETENISKEGDDPNAVGSDRAPLPSGTTDNKGTAQVTISSFNQNDGIFQLRAFIGTITSEGSCALTLTQGTKTVTRTVNVQALPSTTTCKGFDIPLTELAPGAWEATINFENSTLKGSVTAPVKVL